jgi:anthranilate synthase component 2
VILLVDNYDSFVYNIAQALATVGEVVEVRRNDETTLAEVAELRPDGIVISPGPCGPAEAGLSVPLVRQFSERCPILGICLGHQAIGYAFGATIRRAVRPMHGKLSSVVHDGEGVFARVPSPLEAVRYHSLVVDPDSLPASLTITARSGDGDGEIMGLRHRSRPLEGVQFHPESIFTPDGLTMLANFALTCHHHLAGMAQPVGIP